MYRFKQKNIVTNHHCNPKPNNSQIVSGFTIPAGMVKTTTDKPPL